MRPFFILLSVVALLSCVERRTTDPYINGATRVINIPEDYEQNICSDALFESVDLVPLETTEECLIGRVDRLLICDSCTLSTIHVNVCWFSIEPESSAIR